MIFEGSTPDGKRRVIKHDGKTYYKAWLDTNGCKTFPAYICPSPRLGRLILGGEAMVGVFAALFAEAHAGGDPLRYIAVDSIGEELTKKAERLAEELECAVE